jgi:hypothetical protein
MQEADMMRDLERSTRIWSESLARAMDRRTFLKRASQTTFAGLIALAVGHGLPGRAAAGDRTKPPQVPQCAPPGPYCNLDGNAQDPNGCHGGHCFQHRYQGQVIQCHIWYCCYQAGCWTTPSGNGYWTCCDCECGNPAVTTCGCAQYSANPVPSPDRPVVGKISA